MRVFVAGHLGMLGHVAVRYFTQLGWQVLTSSQRYEALPRDPLIVDITASGATWVVNALGKIKQKCSGREQLFVANAVFPLHLRAALRHDQRLIHASTDCVFSGGAGGYRIDSVTDPDDQYGLSKLLAERVAEVDRAFVLRTSVIGPESGGGSGLFSWFLAQRGSVNGYVNHRWNGITTLEWSKVCAEIISGRYVPPTPLFQVGVAPPISKHELLQLISGVWNHPVSVIPARTERDVDRSLEPALVRSPLKQQLAELREWY